MRRIFTEYVRSLDPAGECSDTETFDGVWAALRTVLRAALRKRGLWQAPPHFLGVYGWHSWLSPQGAGSGNTDDALEELTAECYTFIFVVRLRSLKVQLEAKLNVDGLVFLNVRNFLHERQKEFDPLGFQVFETVHSAVRQAVVAGDLHVLSGDPKVRNETVLGFTLGDEPSAKPASGLGDLAEGWTNELLPDLVTARGQARQQVLDRLKRLLPEVAVSGIPVFCFKDLVDAIKHQVRERWAALFDAEEGKTAFEESSDGFLTQVRSLPPETGVEEREAWRKLADCVAGSVERLGKDPQTRRYLSILWQFLRTWSAEPGRGDTTDKLPSQRKLATLLRIPRERLADLYQTLARMIHEGGG